MNEMITLTFYVPRELHTKVMQELTKNYGGARAFLGTGMWREGGSDEFKTDQITMIVAHPVFHPTVSLVNDMLRDAMNGTTVPLIEWNDGYSVYVVRNSSFYRSI